MTGGSSEMFAPTSKVPYTFSEPVHGRRHINSRDNGNITAHQEECTFTPRMTTQRHSMKPDDHLQMLSFDEHAESPQTRERRNPSYISQVGLISHNVGEKEAHLPREPQASNYVSRSGLPNNIISHDNERDVPVPKTGLLYGNSILSRDQHSNSAYVQDGRARNFGGNGSLWTAGDAYDERPKTGKRYGFDPSKEEKLHTPVRGDPQSTGRVRNIQGAGNISHYDPNGPSPAWRPMVGCHHRPEDHVDLLFHPAAEDDYVHDATTPDRVHLAGRAKTPQDNKGMLQHDDAVTDMSQSYRSLRRPGSGRRPDHSYLLDHK